MSLLLVAKQAARRSSLLAAATSSVLANNPVQKSSQKLLFFSSNSKSLPFRQATIGRYHDHSQQDCIEEKIISKKHNVETHSFSRPTLLLASHLSQSRHNQGPGYPSFVRCHSTIASSAAAEEETVHDDDGPDDTSSSSSSNKVLFQDLENLHPASLAALQAKKITAMTDIQAQTWEHVLAGQDVVARARTGQGKTMAFLLPALERIVNNQKEGIQILIISPTRELASQIHETAQHLTKTHARHSNSSNSNMNKNAISCQVLYGGVSKGGDLAAMEKQLPTILTATPGRLLDHLESSVLYRRNKQSVADLMNTVDILVLDEMDRLLDMGFKTDVRRILDYLPSKHDRQTLLFSATVPPSVQEEIRHCVRPNYVTVDCIQEDDPTSHTVRTTQQSHVSLPQSKLISGVVETILYLLYNPQSNMTTTVTTKQAPKVMVFFNTTSQVSFFAKLLRQLGVANVLELHSKLSQAGRSKTSDRFRNAPSQVPCVLLTSDVSARGVDYPNVTHVVQMGTASDRETYIHRLGRTGRAGKSGQGILVLVHPQEEAVWKRDLKGMTIPVHSELQEFLDSNDDEKSTVVTTVMQGLPQALQSFDVSKNASDCYRSLLGFYFQRFRALGFHHPANLVVDMINDFARQAGLQERPGISEKVVEQFGLRNHPDIVVRRSSGRASERVGHHGKGGDTRGFGFSGERRGGSSRNGSHSDRSRHSRSDGGKGAGGFERHNSHHSGRGGRRW